MNEQEFLKNYDASQYENPSVTTDTIILSTTRIKNEDKRKKDERKLEILLIKRKGHPDKGKWAIPGGFLEMSEDLLKSAKREVKEETNIEDFYIEQLYTWADKMKKNGEIKERDPRTKVVTVSHLALVKKDKHRIKADSDALDVAWFTIDRQIINKRKMYNEKENKHKVIIQQRFFLENPNYETIEFLVEKVIEIKDSIIERDYRIETSNGLAFDHERILDYALERLSNKVDYTPIIFNLMGDKFTMSSLQQVYETIKNEKITKVAFGRKFKKYVIDTGEKETGTQRRPAKYYKYQFSWDNWTE